MERFIKNNFYLILTIALSITAVWALFHKGFYGASDDLHIAWLYEMDKIIKIGQFPPRFVSDLSFGFGYPLFNFVFPLPFYLGEIFHIAGFSLVDSIKIIFGISLVGSAIAMYLFLREILPSSFAFAGSMVYLFTPYRSTDVYIRGAIGEALSFVFLPLALYALIKIFKKGEYPIWRYIGLFSLSLGGLILSHDIVSYMFAPFLLLFSVLLWLFAKGKRGIFILASFIAAVGGLLISIYFWLPAILESSFMKYSTVFNFTDHFPTLKQLITPYFGYGASVAGPYDSMSFFLGAVNLFLVVVGGALAIVSWKRFTGLSRSVFLWAFAVFFISIFMMNFRSTFLWNKIPYLPYFQFPWRFLTMTTLSSVIFIIPFSHLKFRFLNLIPVAIGLAAVVLNFGFFRPHDFLERTDGYYINRYIPVPSASSEYLNIQEEYLRLPKDAELRPDNNYPVVFSGKKFMYAVERTDGLNATVAVDASEDLAVSYNKYYFPGWEAAIDGKIIEVRAGKPFGQITVDVPRGKHVLEFKFGETGERRFLDIVSATAVLVVLLSIVVKRNIREK